MKHYRLNSTGRRATALLALGALAVWLFAMWKLPDVLSGPSVRVSYFALPSTLSTAIEQGLRVNQIVPALLLIVLTVAGPLLLWNLAEEWSTTFIVRDDGLVHDTVQGISVLYPWSTIRSLRRVDPESEAPNYELIVDRAAVQPIRNPLLRWLHQQAFGRNRILIYARIDGRDELLQEIVTRAGLQNIVQDESLSVAS